MRRYGWTELSRQLMERAPSSDQLLKIAIQDALAESGMTEDDEWFVRISVIEMPGVEDEDAA